MFWFGNIFWHTFFGSLVLTEHCWNATAWLKSTASANGYPLPTMILVWCDDFICRNWLKTQKLNFYLLDYWMMSWYFYGHTEWCRDTGRLNDGGVLHQYEQIYAKYSYAILLNQDCSYLQKENWNGWYYHTNDVAFFTVITRSASCK